MTMAHTHRERGVHAHQPPARGRIIMTVAPLIAAAAWSAHAANESLEHSVLLRTYDSIDRLVDRAPPKPITPRLARPSRHADSFAVFASPSARNSAAVALSWNDQEPPPAPTGDDPRSIINYRGEHVAAAIEPYVVEDFESEESGRGWSNLVTASHKDLGTFARPTPSGITLNFRANVDRSYDIRLNVYLIPPDDAEGLAGHGPDPDEPTTNRLTILLDGETVLTLNPRAFFRLQGHRPVPRQPIRRVLRLPVAPSHPLVEVTFLSTESPPTGGWSTWGIDDLTMDDPVQDPALGLASGDDFFEPGVFGMVPANSGLTGEIPGLPGNRYATRGFPFADSGPAGPTFRRPRRPPEMDEPEDDEEDMNDEEDMPDMPDPDPEPDPMPPPLDDTPDTPPVDIPIPAPSTVLVLSAAFAAMNRRRR